MRLFDTNYPAIILVISIKKIINMSVKKSLKNRKLWGGRFEEATSPFVERFTSSVSFDNKLYQFMIDKWYPCFNACGHAHGVKPV